MRDNCFRDDGTPRAITSARFTVLGPGRIRWELLADVEVLHHLEVIGPAELPAAMEITQALLQESAHAQKTASQTEIDQETRSLPR